MEDTSIRNKATLLSKVKEDRIYIYLNLDKYTNFISKEATKIFKGIAEIIGMYEFVDLKVML